MLNAQILQLDQFRQPRTVDRRDHECSERKRRRDAWRKIDNQREFLERLRQVAMAAKHYGVEGLAWAQVFTRLDDMELLAAMRGALAVQLMTPASTQGELNWKRRERASRSFGCIDVDAAAVDRLIASDDAWLRASAPGRYRKAVQP
jgi:hypothetical protein